MPENEHEYKPAVGDARETAYKLGVNSITMTPNRPLCWVANDNRLLADWRRGRTEGRHA
jgi:hypothetical protein